MLSITIQVPAPQRAELLREALNLYAVKADALHHHTTDYLTAGAPVERVLTDRTELRALAELIEQLGWRLDLPIRAEAVTGGADLLTEIVRTILEKALTDLPDEFGNASPRPDRIVEAVAPALRRASSALGLLRQAYAASAAAAVAD
jgi:hypothetical protein